MAHVGNRIEKKSEMEPFSKETQFANRDAKVAAMLKIKDFQGNFKHKCSPERAATYFIGSGVSNWVHFDVFYAITQFDWTFLRSVSSEDENKIRMGKKVTLNIFPDFWKFLSENISVSLRQIYSYMYEYKKNIFSGYSE